MLILSRTESEEIVINDNIRIVIVDFGYTKFGTKRVRLGIDAPDSVTVHRREVYDAIKAADRERDDTPQAKRSSL